jgi:hypothetical protein
MPASQSPTYPTTSRSRLDSPWFATACIGAAQLGLTLVVAPLRDFPLDDDWAYGQVVQSILQGHLHLSDFTGPSTVFHAYWGALWCSLFGFSFTVLTVASIVMGLISGLCFYGLARELAIAPRLALIGALTLLLNPITVFMSYIFQTDITFLAMLLATLWAFAAAWQRPRPLVWLALGGLLAAAAVLTRQLGLIPALVAAGLWGYRHGLWRGWPGMTLAAGPSLAGYAALLIWLNSEGGPPWAMTLYSPATLISQMFQPDYAGLQVFRLIYVGGLLAFLLLPLFGLFITRRAAAPVAQAETDQSPGPRPARRFRSWPILLGLIALYAGFYWLGHPFNLASDIVRVQGYVPNLVGSPEKQPPLPPVVWDVLTWVVIPLAAVLIFLIGSAVINGVRGGLRGRDPRRIGIALTMAGLAVLILTDRYLHDTLLLPLLPGLILLLLLRVTRPPWSLLPAGALLGGLAVISLLLLRDYWSWHTVAWQAGQRLVAAGVAPARINGGGEWGYWYLWLPAVQEARAAGQPINEDVHVHLLIPDYVLSFSAQPGHIPGMDTPARAYRICTSAPYKGLLDQSPAYVYTLTRAECPAQ